MILSHEHLQQILAWSKEELFNYGPALALLAVLAVFSKKINRAVGRRHLEPTTSRPNIPLPALWTILLLPAGFWLLSLWATRSFPALFLDVTQEDGWMENGQMILLGLGSVTGMMVSRVLWKKHQRFWACAYFLLALALFWVAGEEVSWGQRFFHLPTPAWLASHNTQQELNLHNLNGVDGEMNSLADRVLSYAVFFCTALWLTGLHRVRRLKTALWLPHPSLIPALCCAISYGEVLRLNELLHSGAEGIPEAVVQLQEPRESILYFSLFAFLSIVLYTLRKDKRHSFTG